MSVQLLTRFLRVSAMRLSIWILMICGSMAISVAQEESPSPTAEQVKFFENKIRPILFENCFGCHGEKKQFAGLRLDSRDFLLKGGDLGPSIVPGKPDESLLIKAVRHTDESLQMPQEGKLTDEQITDLVRWVEMGAPFPEASKSTTAVRNPKHWSFQPPTDHPLPAITNTAWPRNEIDHFILSRLESASISPAPAADKLTLIRRVTFDLTGLPPTPEEITEFLADHSEQAYSRLVDRLLESPAYGEKWGRHWLDIARYADSNGLDENVAHGNAWRYRDYVVAAHNSDKPYDRFITEQLAGDLLPTDDIQQRHQNLVATGFISIGPKVLAEVNMDKMKMDIIDEQLDTVGRVFLGMTLGCARCHDHKFDPIDTVDYYALAGIFKSTKTMDTYTKVALWHENDLSSETEKKAKAEADARRNSKKEILDTLTAGADKLVRDKLAADAKPPEKLETLYSETVKTELAKLKTELAELEKNIPELPSAMGVVEDAVVDVAVNVRGNPSKLGDIVPRRTPPVIIGATPPQFLKEQSGRKQLADWLTDPNHPLTARVLVNRVWRWHFGKGIVRSTDNFGLLGDTPTHPELLDWLARRFVAEGWSLKSLHRLILNSSAYQQQSIATPEVVTKDPENQLFSRMNLRRLEAEEVRDALLAVSGQLDKTLGGSLLKVKNRGYLFDHTSIDLTDYNSRRRSLYLPVIRNNVYDLFQLLDFPDPAVPSGDRATTTVAPQALLMMNSDLVMQCADDLAERLLKQEGDEADRLNHLSLIAYGRDFTDAEKQANLIFLAQAEQALSSKEPDTAKRHRQAWNMLCHVVCAANEFIYLK